jgi:hypothetical protein
MVTRSRRLRRAVKLFVRTAVVVPHAERLIATMRERYRQRGGAIDVDGLNDVEGAVTGHPDVNQQEAHPRYITPERAIGNVVDAADRLVEYCCDEAGLFLEQSGGGILKADTGWLPPIAMPDAVGVSMSLTIEVPDPPRFVSAMREQHARFGGAIDVGDMTDEEALAVTDLKIEEMLAHPRQVSPETAIPSVRAAVERFLLRALADAEVYVESVSVGIARRVRQPRPPQGQRGRDAQQRRLLRRRGTRPR